MHHTRVCTILWLTCNYKAFYLEIKMADRPFMKTPSGICRAIELVSCVIAITCSILTSLHAPGAALTFFNAVVIASLIFSILTLLFRVSHMYDTFSDGCVLIFEVVFCIIFAITCLVASGWMVQFGGNRDGRLVVAAAFGFLSTFAFLCDAFFLVQERNKQRRWKTREMDLPI